MELSGDTCYRAIEARDPRFDGVFFVGVRTTGIYCRPVCRARTPARDRCVFFRHAAEAEHEGFRACFRCRPELSPGNGPVDAVPRLVTAALARIDAGALNEGSVDALATELGVTGRHLRRALAAEIGVSPVELAGARRLALAKQLLEGTHLPIAEVAFASGFASVRRFNALFRSRFGAPPSSLRRRAAAAPADTITLRLDYRPPLDWETLLSFIGGRAVPGVESTEGGVYRRAVRGADGAGFVVVRPDPGRPSLRAEVSLALAGDLMPIVAKLRGLFDLDAHPAVIAAHLGSDPLLAPLVAARPGLRVPGAFDGFELAVRAILGQQITVRAATSLAGRLAEAFGDAIHGGAASGPTPRAPAEPMDGPPPLRLLFPRPEALERAGEDAIAALGMPGARARAVVALARAVAREGLRLDRRADPVRVGAQLEALPGVGRWTAAYVAMRALGWPDAFPASDLGIRNALGGLAPRAAEARAEPLRPFRAYAALHLWTSLSIQGPRPYAPGGRYPRKGAGG